jgi:hypothetical protein
MTNSARRAGILLTLVAVACGQAVDPGEVTDVAQVTCEQNDTRLLTETVRAQPDGVHFRIDGLREGRVSVYYRRGEAVRHLQEVQPGESRSIVTAGPGPWELICVAPSRYPAENDPWVPLRVIDPDHLWVADELDCEHPTGTHPDYREDFEGGTPTGQDGELVELARESIRASAMSVLPGDVLEPAGYPEGPSAQVRLVREGRVVAVARFQADGQGGWIDRGVDYCEGA